MNSLPRTVTGRMPFLLPNQQCQSTEGNNKFARTTREFRGKPTWRTHTRAGTTHGHSIPTSSCGGHLVAGEDAERLHHLVGGVRVGRLAGHEVQERVERDVALVVGIHSGHDALEVCVALIHTHTHTCTHTHTHTHTHAHKQSVVSHSQNALSRSDC